MYSLVSKQKMMKNILFSLTFFILTSCELKYVTPEPVIDSFTPGSGKAGVVVTIHGSCFGSQPVITVNGISATVTTVVSTKYTYSDIIIFTIPALATTGKIKITNSGGTTVSAVNFVVIQ